MWHILPSILPVCLLCLIMHQLTGQMHRLAGHDMVCLGAVAETYSFICWGRLFTICSSFILSSSLVLQKSRLPRLWLKTSQQSLNPWAYWIFRHLTSSYAEYVGEIIPWQETAWLDLSFFKALYSFITCQTLLEYRNYSLNTSQWNLDKQHTSS